MKPWAKQTGKSSPVRPRCQAGAYSNKTRLSAAVLAADSATPAAS